MTPEEKQEYELALKIGKKRFGFRGGIPAG